MDHAGFSGSPEWHAHASQYGSELAMTIGAACLVERFDAGKSFEFEMARIRYVKGGLTLIIEFCESSELFVEEDAEAIDSAFKRADPFDGSVATLRIEKVRQAHMIAAGQIE